jgi:hypothetical protein
MFRISRINVIESDEGFSVEVLGRTRILYTERTKKLHVDSEVLAGPSGLVIYKASFQAWDPPDDNETIDENKRNAILENIRQAFSFRGVKISVI